MDSTCILIGQQVCFSSTTKHENDVSYMIDCLQVVRSYIQFYERNKRASHIVFLFVKSETNNFINDIKHVLRATENMFYFLDDMIIRKEMV